MSKISGFTFFRSYYESLKELEPESRREILDAMMSYVFDDIEPEFKGIKFTIWTLILPNLSISKSRSKNARKKTKQNQNKNKNKSNENQNKNNDLLEDKDKGMDKGIGMDMDKDKGIGKGVISSFFEEPEIEERATLGNSKIFDFNWMDDD